MNLNLIRQNRTLSLAIALSVLTHGILLTVRFVSPESFRMPPANPGLEVVLVNAKHSKAPLNPDALAQANLDGGGNADDGRSKSPLPDMGRMVDGDSLQVTRRRSELQEQQQKLMAQIRQAGLLKAPKVHAKSADSISTVGANDADSVAISRQAAEIAKTIEDQNKRPKKTHISPSTQSIPHAMYYKTMQRRIEDMGSLNFPQKDGQKLYGELMMSIPVFHDGTIYEKEGGPGIEKSSGNTALDQAAIRIVRRAAPFGRFPPNMRSKNGDVWEVHATFQFTRDQVLQTQMRGGE